MIRDSFVFYRSFYEALAGLEDSDRLACLDAICEYALDGVEPGPKGIAFAVWLMAKPQIDKNNERYLNGKRGGRPSGNQTETKRKPSGNHVGTNSEANVNVNDNVNVNVNDKDTRTRTRARKNAFCSFSDQHRYDFDELAKALGMTVGGAT